MIITQNKGTNPLTVLVLMLERSLCKLTDWKRSSSSLDNTLKSICALNERAFDVQRYRPSFQTKKSEIHFSPRNLHLVIQRERSVRSQILFSQRALTESMLILHRVKFRFEGDTEYM
ncbi:MAG: hypothetical protein GY786_05280 [Proteobacteria bacterium]|nr:hypothetical protein [Pseudomonadota bacterium]